MFKTQKTVIRTISFLLALMLVRGVLIFAQDDDNSPTVVVGRLATILAAPDSEADSLGRPPQARLIVTGITIEEDFYRIDLDGLDGWVSESAVLEIDGDLSNVPVIGDETDNEMLNDMPIIILEGLTTIRSSPESGAETVARVKDMNLTIIGISEDSSYYLVSFEGQEGWVRAYSFLTIEGDLSLVPTVDPNAPAVTPEPEPCFISTEQAQTVRVRVGYGEDRTSVTHLAVDTEFEALGQNSDIGGNVWYALDKELAAPGKSIRGDVGWVLASEVHSTGDCEEIPIVDAEGKVPIREEQAEIESNVGESNEGNSVSILIGTWTGSQADGSVLVIVITHLRGNQYRTEFTDTKSSVTGPCSGGSYTGVGEGSIVENIMYMEGVIQCANGNSHTDLRPYIYDPITDTISVSGTSIILYR